MVKAYSLISVEPGRTAEAFQRIKEVKGVIKAECVAGPYDIIARIEVEELEEFTKTIFQHVRTIPGVTNTTTLIVVEI